MAEPDRKTCNANCGPIQGLGDNVSKHFRLICLILVLVIGGPVIHISRLAAFEKEKAAVDATQSAEIQSAKEKQAELLSLVKANHTDTQKVLASLSELTGYVKAHSH